MHVTDDGIQICFKKQQSLKVDSPIFVTEDGIIISSMLENCFKLKLLSEITSGEIINFVNDDVSLIIDVIGILHGSHSSS